MNREPLVFGEEVVSFPDTSSISYGNVDLPESELLGHPKTAVGGKLQGMFRDGVFNGFGDRSQVGPKERVEVFAGGKVSPAPLDTREISFDLGSSLEIAGILANAPLDPPPRPLLKFGTISSDRVNCSGVLHCLTPTARYFKLKIGQRSSGVNQWDPDRKWGQGPVDRKGLSHGILLHLHRQRSQSTKAM